jgi:hypothetical protein
MRLLRPNRIIWMAVGAAGAYYFDPDNGSTRRAALLDTVAAKRREIAGEPAPEPYGSPRAVTPASSAYDSGGPSTVGVPGDGSASSQVG